MIKVNVKVPPEIYNLLKEYSKRSGLSVSELVRWAVEELLLEEGEL